MTLFVLSTLSCSCFACAFLEKAGEAQEYALCKIFTSLYILLLSFIANAMNTYAICDILVFLDFECERPKLLYLILFTHFRWVIL